MDGSLNDSILLKELKIYQWIFSVFGFNLPPFLIYRPQKDVKYYFVLIIYILYCLILLGGAIWAAYVHNIIVRKATLRHHLDFMTELVTYIQNVAMAGLQLLFVYKSCCCHRKLWDILLSIKKLEQIMLTICPIMFDDQVLKKRLLLTTAPGLFFSVSFLIYFNIMLLASNMELRDKLLAVIFLMTVQMKFLEYGIYVQLLYEYLLMLLKSLRSIKGKVENAVGWKKPLEWYFCKTLRLNQGALMKIWFLIYKLEQYFAWPMLLLFFYNVIIIMCTYKKFSHILLNFKLYPHDKQMIMVIKEYSQQLMHQPIQFSCSGYMNIDLMFYGKASLLILTYVIILVQFKLTD
ncbi:putative gustatory receptor 98b, partial [Lucilia sericata]|uniref:putative gustatory receptor 98b n=1 Tax=Lucilia sericata TaxID=13632 RepID=UPI0018A80D7E